MLEKKHISTFSWCVRYFCVPPFDIGLMVFVFFGSLKSSVINKNRSKQTGEFEKKTFQNRITTRQRTNEMRCIATVMLMTTILCSIKAIGHSVCVCDDEYIMATIAHIIYVYIHWMWNEVDHCCKSFGRKPNGNYCYQHNVYSTVREFSHSLTPSLLQMLKLYLRLMLVPSERDVFKSTVKAKIYCQISYCASSGLCVFHIYSLYVIVFGLHLFLR